jgi:hypothetical protein
MFLFSVSRIVNEKLYNVLGIFFRNLRECLNEFGYDKIREYFERDYPEESKSLIPKRNQDRPFTEKENPDFVPIISDYFILEYLPRYCPDFDQQFAVDLMHDFCVWLLKKKLTKIKINFADQETIIILDDDDSEPEVKAKPFGKLR